jgi:transposase
VAGRNANDAKSDALRGRGCLNPHPEEVVDPAFAGTEFLDPRDLVQVKYEMVRKVSIEGESVAASAAAFGFSRPTFYQARAALDSGGLPALVPARPGPRRAHKLNDEVVDFIEATLTEDPDRRPRELAPAVFERFGIEVHPRSIERALHRRQEKKRR